MKKHELADFERDALGKVGNIAMGAAAAALSGIVGREVRVITPRIQVKTRDEIIKDCQRPCLLCTVDYLEGLSGRSIFIIKEQDAAVIFDLMVGGDGSKQEPVDEMALSTIGEVVDQMLQAAATSMFTMFSVPVRTSAPQVDLANAEALDLKDQVVQMSFALTINSLVESEIIQLMDLEFAQSMVAKLSGGEGAVEKRQEGMTEMRPASFAEFAPNETKGRGRGNLNLILDVPLEVTVELGRARRNVRDVLALDVGSVLELDRQAGEPVEILVNGRLVARGEVVVIDESFGVRVTEILEVTERVAGL